LSIKSIDDENAVLINPWNINEEITVKREELLKAERIEYMIFN